MLRGDSPKAMFIMIGPGGVIIVVVVVGGGA